MVSTFSAFLVVMLHFHRLIILRRVWFLLGCLYYYRALTMFVTVLPKADPSYTCKPKLDNTTALPALVIFKRILTLMSGMGLSINGKHIYCGDYIFSGHTMVLTMGYLVIRECKYYFVKLLSGVNFR
ncbi:phosphatidylcholine:ceramide cholinephosphotransferase 2 [Eurytemora carolleeae]|uniref:phosphatidylcholine:ceramide cholinephosphotransferase 2 n=1 Tax=Eurytemora carolleeae TaxID=1294199 RepID=UPI000C7612D9|nr:phosphatidylcholine:ceramide cholinephosphotransferase 2 [Eurytemora carolleeae]|eukprot:XP_023322318.1 phosphatidylcholine:ceramide cholinephosphotransferase 2-like [Eurytemora affinis]